MLQQYYSRCSIMKRLKIDEKSGSSPQNKASADLYNIIKILREKESTAILTYYRHTAK